MTAMINMFYPVLSLFTAGFSLPLPLPIHNDDGDSGGNDDDHGRGLSNHILSSCFLFCFCNDSGT
jgi:hypothetical protein